MVLFSSMASGAGATWDGSFKTYAAAAVPFAVDVAIMPPRRDVPRKADVDACASGRKSVVPHLQGDQEESHLGDKRADCAHVSPLYPWQLVRESGMLLFLKHGTEPGIGIGDVATWMLNVPVRVGLKLRALMKYRPLTSGCHWIMDARVPRPALSFCVIWTRSSSSR